MRPSVSTQRPFLGRFLLISSISLFLVFGLTGFGAHVQKPVQTPPVPSEDVITSEFVTVLSHNLVVDTEEYRCLALNIYFEARSEPLSGQIAVAGVTMNRVADPRFPDSICGVVQQRASYRLHRCQFSWFCDGQADDPTELTAWRSSQQLARLFLAGVYSDTSGDAMWYHADYVDPHWAPYKEKTTKIGRHIFYKAKDRQLAAR